VKVRSQGRSSSFNISSSRADLFKIRFVKNECKIRLSMKQWLASEKSFPYNPLFI
jgi:hypothetical protein